jgi:hypothetical protein
VGDEARVKMSVFQLRLRDSDGAKREIEMHTNNLVNTVQRLAQELAELQSMFGALCMAAREAGMKEIPLEPPHACGTMPEFQSRIGIALRLFEGWETLGERDAETILKILYPERATKGK